MADYKLTYFNARGAAEPIRLIFALAKVPFEDNRFPAGSQGIPAELKPKLPFGQVPVLDFGGVTLSQSGAIARFLAKKFNLLGSDAVEAAKIDEVIDAGKDYADTLRATRMAKDEEAKAAAMKNVLEVSTPKYVGKFNDILQKNGTGFLVGKSVSLADLYIFNLFNGIKIISGMDLTQGYPAVQTFVAKIEAIPEIHEWLEKRPKTEF